MKAQIFLAALFLISSLSPPRVNSAEDVDTIIKMLNSGDWVVRERGIMASVKLTNNNQVKVELIKLLEKENQQSERLEEGLPVDESSGEYYIELVDAVVRLNDPRSIRGLVGAVDTGVYVINVLVSFGEEAIDPLIDVFANTKRRSIKPNIIKTLDKILAEKTVAVAHKNKVKHFLLDQLNATPSRNVKRNIIAAIVNFSDDDQVVTVLESLIASDTYYEMRRVKGRPRTERVKVFPLKEEAEKTMGRIRAKRKEKGMGLPAGTTQQYNP